MNGPMSLPLISWPVACLSYRTRTSGGNAVTLNNCCVLMGGNVPLEDWWGCCGLLARSMINFWNSGVSALFALVRFDCVDGVTGTSSIAGSVPQAVRSVGVNSC